MTDNKLQPNEESSAVQAHLAIEQNVIQRMAENSSSCKAWCITLVSAILVVIADKNRPNLAILAFIPVLLFFALDAYYLALEKRFRDSYSTFLKKLHARNLNSDELFAVVPLGKQLPITFESMKSFSVWPFYGTLAIMIVVMYAVVL